MDTSRIVTIILSELSTENLKIQERIESTINSTSLSIDDKTFTVKNHLTNLVINEMSITKFQSMIQPNNQAQTNQTENGKV